MSARNARPVHARRWWFLGDVIEHAADYRDFAVPHPAVRMQTREGSFVKLAFFTVDRETGERLWARVVEFGGDLSYAEIVTSPLTSLVELVRPGVEIDFGPEHVTEVGS